MKYNREEVIKTIEALHDCGFYDDEDDVPMLTEKLKSFGLTEETCASIKWAGFMDRDSQSYEADYHSTFHAFRFLPENDENWAM